MCADNGNESCCGPGQNSFRVEALVSVDERGQMVLPKELREKADIHPGDKLAVTTWESDGKVCCIALIKASEITQMVKNMLGPLVKDLS